MELSQVWLVLIIFVEIVLCVQHIRTTKSDHSRQRAKFFMVGISVPLILGFFTELFFPAIGILLPELTMPGMLFGILFIGYGIIKNELLSITTGNVAQNIATKMADALILINASKKIVASNEAAIRLLNSSEDELLNLPFESLEARIKTDKPHEMSITDILEKNGSFLDMQMTLTHKHNKTIPVSLSGFIQREEDDTIVGYIILIRDISEYKETEKALRQSEDRYRSIMESVMEGYYEVDLDGNITFTNDVYEKITGYTKQELFGKNFWSLLSEETAEQMRNASKRIFHSGIPEKNIRYEITAKNGNSIILESSATLMRSNEGKPIGISGMTRDITEHIRLEEMVIQSEKMLSIGGLAAGMAHEINNPLAGIMQNTQVLRNRISAGLPMNQKAAEKLGISMESIQSYMKERDIFNKLELILDSAKRIAKIVDNMLGFSRKGGSVFGMHDLGQLLDKTIELASNEYDLKKKYDFREISIVREYDKNVPKIPCESSKLQQVFFNLLQNGAQAMFENKKSINPPCFHLRIKLDGDMVRIEVEDNGPGMEKHTSKRIFEPFFTTKEIGVGTGLGLSVSYFIITKNHSGTMKVESSPGQGARFIIDLPYKKA